MLTEIVSYYVEAFVAAAFGIYLLISRPDIALWSFVLFGQAIMNLGRCYLQPDIESKNKGSQRLARTVNEYGSWIACVTLLWIAIVDTWPDAVILGTSSQLSLHRGFAAFILLVPPLIALPTLLSEDLTSYSKLRTFRSVVIFPVLLLSTSRTATMHANNGMDQFKNVTLAFLELFALFLAYKNRFSKKSKSKRTGTSRFIPAWRFGTLLWVLLHITAKMNVV